jgi:septal ring factor EnvC (AmiA/AmiB activator)
MKNIKILSVFALIALFTNINFAQEMTKEQWLNEMNNLKAKKGALNTQINALRTDIDNLKSMNLKDPEECIDELYQMVGANRSDVDNFRRAVNDLNGKINRKEGPKADRQTDLNVLKVNKISAYLNFIIKFMLICKER